MSALKVTAMFDLLWHDLHYGWRVMRKYPLFSAMVVLTLGFAIGANSVIFSIVYSVLVRPLPFHNPSRLVLLGEDIPKMRFKEMGFSAPDLEVFRRNQRAFEGIGAFQTKYVSLSTGKPERLVACRVTTSLFPLLGVTPLLGRNFTKEEDARRAHVVLLSYGFWKGHFEGDRNILGKVIDIDRQLYTIVGVMPRQFVFPLAGPHINSTPADLWIPMEFTRAELNGWGTLYTNTVVGRLRPGITIGAARSEAKLLSRLVLSRYPAALTAAFGGARLTIGVYRYHQAVVGKVRSILLIFFGAVAFVLMIACANIATLLLTRTALRRREIALRIALGAPKSALVRQLMVENLFLTLSGGLVGLWLAFDSKYWVLSLVPNTMPLPHSQEFSGMVVLFVLAVSFLIAILFGVLPSVQLSADETLRALQEGGPRLTMTRRQQRLQGSFVVLQLALALVLLVGTGLLLRSLQRLMQVNLGFQASHLLTLNLPLPWKAYASAAQVRELYEHVDQRVDGLPGVRSTAMASDLPLTGCIPFAIKIGAGSNTPQAICITWVLGDYFKTMGIHLLSGRGFSAQDREGSLPVAIVSQAMARKFWPGENPIGKRIRWGVSGPWQSIVGVVGNVHDKAPGQPVQLRVYEPYLQLPDLFFQSRDLNMFRSMNLVIRTGPIPASLASPVVHQIHLLDPELAVAKLRPMREVVASSVSKTRFSTVVFGFFAGVALILAAIGLYGVQSYTVAQQTREIGIRLALGAQTSDIRKMVLRRGLLLAGGGAVIGLGAALALSRILRGLLYGISDLDPLIFFGVAVALISVAVISCYIPARRAMKVEPLAALHEQ